MCMASKRCRKTLGRLLSVIANASAAAHIKSAHVFNALSMTRLPIVLLSLPPTRGQCCGVSRCRTTTIFNRCLTTPRSCVKEDFSRVAAMARHALRARRCESNPKHPELFRSKIHPFKRSLLACFLYFRNGKGFRSDSLFQHSMSVFSSKKEVKLFVCQKSVD